MKDPEPHARVWFRHIQSGDRGYLVERNGRSYVKLDRPMEDIVRPLGDLWLAEADPRPMTQMQAAQVAFEADKQLCFFLGLHKESRREWLNLKAVERIDWTDHGPPKDEARQKLFKDVMKSLRKLVG